MSGDWRWGVFGDGMLQSGWRYRRSAARALRRYEKREDVRGWHVRRYRWRAS